MIRTPKGGTVNVPDGGHAKTGNFPWRFPPGTFPWRFSLALRGCTRFGDLVPDDDRRGTKRPIAG
jgi:hypothetical protein